MKILILGATGKTGQQLVQQALKAGHKVTAFVRDPAKLEISEPNLSISVGDVRDQQTLEKALVGQEAVLVALGPKSMREKLMEPATKALIAAMKTVSIKRVVMLSSFISHPNFHASGVMKIMMPFMKAPFQDKILAEILLKQSDLEWIIVYGTGLTNGPWTGQYKVSMIPPGGMSFKISRADVADFMLKQITDDKFVHKLPVLSY